MKIFALLFITIASTALAAVPQGGPKIETDTGTVGFLRRHLVSGADIGYPLEAAKAKQQGSVFYLMKLRADGSVESLKLKKSTGHKALDENVRRTLNGYRFKPKTKSPLLWLVSFAQPATVIVKCWRVEGDDVQLPPTL